MRHLTVSCLGECFSERDRSFDSVQKALCKFLPRSQRARNFRVYVRTSPAHGCAKRIYVRVSYLLEDIQSQAR